MAHKINFDAPLALTHIGTATAIIHLDGVNILTDPFFSPANTEWDMGILVLKNSDNPALTPEDLPPIDAVLLSHEDHPDNLDEPGRQVLKGKQVLTTPDGAKNLSALPGVRAMRPWETVSLEIGSQTFQVTGTPCEHLPGGEVTGFILTTPSFGQTDGKPNAIYFSGDTIYLPDLARMRHDFHISLALLNIGKAVVPLPTGPLKITMDGADAARLFRDIGADVLVPMHFESWAHFTEKREELARALEREGVMDRVLWLEPGVRTGFA
ncbi:hypothetical protein N0V88_006600 [Collariella sp. IMI 366227]|nr:hypothetical protein N0V88_006600 [Collariella sp. IMI 366227]